MVLKLKNYLIHIKYINKKKNMFFINVFFNIISMNYEITTYVFNYVQQQQQQKLYHSFFFLQYKIKNFSKII
jgi:hypothetical protein